MRKVEVILARNNWFKCKITLTRLLSLCCYLAGAFAFNTTIHTLILFPMLSWAIETNAAISKIKTRSSLANKCFWLCQRAASLVCYCCRCCYLWRHTTTTTIWYLLLEPTIWGKAKQLMFADADADRIELNCISLHCLTFLTSARLKLVRAMKETSSSPERLPSPPSASLCAPWANYISASLLMALDLE